MGAVVPRVRSYVDRGRRHVTGPMLLLVLIVVIEALARTSFRIPNPTPFLLLAVVYSAFMDDRVRAAVTTLVAVAHTAVYFSMPGALLAYAADDAYRVLVMLVVAPVMAGMTVLLKERAALLERERGARQAAERDRDFVRLVIAHSPYGIMVTRGLDHTVELVNPAAEKLLRLRHDACVGRPVALISPTFYNEITSTLNEAFSKGTTREIDEFSIQLPDASRATVMLTAVPLADSPEHNLGLLVMMTDITARKRAEDDLAEARLELLRVERLATLGAMLSGVAHEIRTPLALISNTTHVLKGRLDRGDAFDADAAKLLLEDVLSGVDRANELVLELRKFVRVEPSKRELVVVGDTVRQALRLFAATHPGAQAVQTDIQDVPSVLGDPRHLQQVVLNLVENAIAASGPDGEVGVRVARASQGVEIAVTDNGPGMTPDVRDRAFEAFFTTKQDGTGLGLAIVKRLVEAHGGSVACESGPDKGTTIRVTLPVAETSVRVEIEGPPEAAPPSR